METDKSYFQMIDVSQKSATFRKAEAQGTIQLSQESFLAIQNGNNPKGNVLALAEVAAIMAAKRTADWIPLCHPLPLEQVQVRFKMCPDTFSVTVLCTVSTFAKTGVEMEALCGVNGALLSIYDLSKAIHPKIEISGIRLNYKLGGKSGKEEIKDLNLRAAVITVSDRVAQGEKSDQSGPYLVEQLRGWGCHVESWIVPDEPREIQAAVNRAVKEYEGQLILTTGGTGLGPRDVTPEAVIEMSDRQIPGLGELLRSRGAQSLPAAWLSCSVATLMESSLIICLPGSLRAVQEGLEYLRPLLPHALHIAQGGHHEKG